MPGPLFALPATYLARHRRRLDLLSRETAPALFRSQTQSELSKIVATHPVINVSKHSQQYTPLSGTSRIVWVIIRSTILYHPDGPHMPGQGATPYTLRLIDVFVGPSNFTFQLDYTSSGESFYVSALRALGTGLAVAPGAVPSPPCPALAVMFSAHTVQHSCCSSTATE